MARRSALVGVTAPAPPAPAVAGLRGAARGGAVNLAGTAFTGLAGLGVTWLVAHSMDGRTAHAGAFFTATAAFTLATTVAKLGSQTSLVYWPARLRAQGQDRLLAQCLRVGLVPVALVGVALAALLWLAAPALVGSGPAHPGGGLTPGGPAHTGGGLTPGGPAHTGGGLTPGGPVHTGGGAASVGGQLHVLAPFLPLAALSDAVLAATRGYRSMRPTVLLDRILRPALQLGAVAVVSAVSAPLLPVAWAAPFAASALLSATALRRLHSRLSTVDDNSPTLAREFWTFAGPRALASVAQLALQRVDILLVAALAGLPAAAVYTVAGRFVVLGQFVNQAVSQAVQPRLAERLAVDDRSATRALYRYATAWLVLATWPLYLLVASYPSVYLGPFGPGYRTGAPIVVVLAGAMLLATACGMVDMVLAMAGRTRWNLANVALALAVTLGVDLVAVPRFGALGAAVGLAAAVCADNLVPLAQIGYALRLRPFGHATVAAGALAVGCFGVPALALRIAAGPPSLGVAAAVVCTGGVAYLAGVLRLRRLLGLPTVKACQQ